MSTVASTSPNSSWNPALDRNPRPLPPRRPSALRNSASDHLITPAVTRFDPETADIPPSPTFPPSSSSSSPSHSSAETSESSSSNVDSPSLLSIPPPSLTHRPATCPQSVPKPCSPPTSLLARRRSSRSTARPDFLPKLDDLKISAFPAPPLEELDDTVRPDVIGVGSQATTPFASSPTSVAGIQEAPFRPTKTYASTPFPKGRRQSFFDESEEEEEEGEESGNSDDDDGRSTAESSVLDESTDGIRRFSLTDSEEAASKD
ncbi:uncharacterized protein JCM6883_001488 [Sporobolomyces salmoneus]|uniref:uncharacterized protein n=1 Tax=Sporobolomyces salmoneus TaxID=183962 RepID=UPI00317E995C